MGIKPEIKQKIVNEDYKRAIAKAAELRPKQNISIPLPITKKEQIETDIDEEKDRKFHELRGIIIAKVLLSYERLERYPNLLALFGDIMMYRLEYRKDKICFLKATVNQITVGIDMREEDLKGIV